MHFCDDLAHRADIHDLSKLEGSEAEGFASILKVLESHPYGSPEYMKSLNSGCIQAHYKANRHHPEYHPRGMIDMTLMDVVEMFCDWQAASQRRKDGTIVGSVEFNVDRFGPCSIWDILLNTAKDARNIGQLGTTTGVYPPYQRGWMWGLQDMGENCGGCLIKDTIERPEAISEQDWPEFLRGYLAFNAHGHVVK